MPFHIAADRRNLIGVHWLACQNGVESLAQVAPIQRLVVPGTASIQLSSVSQRLAAPFITSEQIELWCAGRFSERASVWS